MYLYGPCLFWWQLWCSTVYLTAEWFVESFKWKSTGRMNWVLILLVVCSAGCWVCVIKIGGSSTNSTPNAGTNNSVPVNGGVLDSTSPLPVVVLWVRVRFCPGLLFQTDAHSNQQNFKKFFSALYTHAPQAKWFCCFQYIGNISFD